MVTRQLFKQLATLCNRNVRALSLKSAYCAIEFDQLTVRLEPLRTTRAGRAFFLLRLRSALRGHRRGAGVSGRGQTTTVAAAKLEPPATRGPVWGCCASGANNPRSIDLIAGQALLP